MLATNKTFVDIYEDAETFVNDYKTSGLYSATNKITDASASTLFYLLYARYGNNSIVNHDETQFKYKLFSIIYMYGPSWEKRLEIQAILRGLDEDSLILGSTQIYNHSYNPSTLPSASTTDELTTINDQNVSKSKRSKLDAYNVLVNLLETDVTKEFIDKFKKLFMTIGFDVPEVFATEIEEE